MHTIEKLLDFAIGRPVDFLVQHVPRPKPAPTDEQELIEQAEQIRRRQARLKMLGLEAEVIARSERDK